VNEPIASKGQILVDGLLINEAMAFEFEAPHILRIDMVVLKDKNNQYNFRIGSTHHVALWADTDKLSPDRISMVGLVYDVCTNVDVSVACVTTQVRMYVAAKRTV
jgi:hypothetical protein